MLRAVGLHFELDGRLLTISDSNRGHGERLFGVLDLDAKLVKKPHQLLYSQAELNVRSACSHTRGQT